jgi:hypothetical protein
VHTHTHTHTLGTLCALCTAPRPLRMAAEMLENAHALIDCQTVQPLRFAPASSRNRTGKYDGLTGGPRCLALGCHHCNLLPLHSYRALPRQPASLRAQPPSHSSGRTGLNLVEMCPSTNTLPPTGPLPVEPRQQKQLSSWRPSSLAYRTASRSRVCRRWHVNRPAAFIPCLHLQVG